METPYISITEYNKLKTEIEKIKDENKELTERLKKYTAPKTNHRYYETHKEQVIKKVKEYREKHGVKKASPEKIKEYSRRAYLKKKQKIIDENNNN